MKTGYRNESGIYIWCLRNVNEIVAHYFYICITRKAHAEMSACDIIRHLDNLAQKAVATREESFSDDIYLLDDAILLEFHLSHSGMNG
jgi:hypothetical protein